MKPKNLISALNSSKLEIEDRNLKDGFNLDTHESNTLEAFINELNSICATNSCYNGYFVSYNIKQISKEFDLLRFGHTSIINIELKSSLDAGIRENKITRQMSQNHYYLKFLNLDVIIYTYIENDGLYYWDIDSCSPIKVDVQHLINNLNSQTVNHIAIPDNLFIPRNYFHIQRY